MQDLLTKEVLEYQRTGKGLKKLVEQIGIRVYKYPRHKCGWSDDECSDFFVDFYSHVPKLVERFKYTGKPFGAYLAVTLKWKMKSFVVKRRMDSFKQKVIVENIYAVEELRKVDLLKEETVDYRVYKQHLDRKVRDSFKLDQHGCIPRLALRRRILYVVMKECLNIPDNFLPTIAKIIDCEVEELYGYIHQARLLMDKKLERLEYLRQRRNRIYLKLHVLYEKLKRETDLSKKQDLLLSLKKSKERLNGILKIIASVPISPSHKEIADIIQIPKGTIDSGVFYLRNSFRKENTSQSWEN